MMSNSLKKWLVGFSLLTGVTYTVIYACADGFWGYQYQSSFTPETYVDKSYTPLFFSDEMFYNIGHDTEYTSRFNNDIVQEWDGYLDGKIKKEDLAYLILKDSAKAELNNLYEAAFAKKSLKYADRKIALKDKKVKNFLEFMYYAKMIEEHATVAYNYWDYENRQVSYVAPEVIREVENKFTKATDAFLKNRYWFQVMKAYFYSDSKQQAIVFFEKTKAQVPQNVLYYRALSYIAGVYYKDKDYVKANYLYSVVFDKCPQLRVVTAYNFHPQEQSDFDAALQLAKSNDEKAALWALLGYYADERKAIDAIYQLNPKSEHLEYLLTRLVNKEETELNGEEFKSVKEYKKVVKEKLNKESLALLNKIAGEEQTLKPYLWNIAAGYLNIFNGDYALAEKQFAKAESKAPKTELSAKQLRLLKLINTLSRQNVMNADAESKLLTDLNWLYHECPKSDYYEPFRYTKALGWSKKYIAALYKTQKNGIMTELFDRDNKYYLTGANQEAMKTFLMRNKKSPWEQLAVSIYDVTLSDIYEYQAVMSAYTNKIEQAIAFMEKSEKGKEVILEGNPFNGKIKDCNDCDHQAYQKVKYTKLSFLQKLKEMQDKVTKGEEVYSNSLLLANAFYNMTYYGNARSFYYSNIMDQGGNYIDEDYKPYLLNPALANSYYKKAFEAAANPEQKAKCVYMMAKCERNAFYTDNYHTNRYDYRQPEVHFLAWNGFKKLKAEYSNTQYYKEVINECGYFQKYLGMN